MCINKIHFITGYDKNIHFSAVVSRLTSAINIGGKPNRSIAMYHSSELEIPSRLTLPVGLRPTAVAASVYFLF